ncbi:MAG: hypothetical protein KGL10_00580 [Alphaproteobacteria bacterium]|nr:hypothetical protein [Alphaproteobacteria bacterium]MDE2335788.1 hypothetical protein [Alphaproteobacteria bacterium]
MTFLVKDPPATAHDIANILGPTDRETVSAISRTGASRAEIWQAKAWLDDNRPADGSLQKDIINDNVRRVYDILAEERDRYTTYETG